MPDPVQPEVDETEPSPKRAYLSHAVQEAEHGSSAPELAGLTNANGGDFFQPQHGDETERSPKRTRLPHAEQEVEQESSASEPAGLPNASGDDFLQPQHGGDDDALFNHTERNADGSDGKVRTSPRARPVQSADPCPVLRPFWFDNRRHTRCAQGTWQKAQAWPDPARRPKQEAQQW
jgi:hypothetical protein